MAAAIHHDCLTCSDFRSKRSRVTVRFGAFAFDSERRQLTRDDQGIHLTPKAFDLLSLLIAEAPRVVRKDELHQRLWTGTFVSDATLVSLIKEIRRALADRNSERPVIRTAHGVGYAFAGEFEHTGVPALGTSRWIIAGSRRIVLTDGEHTIGRDPASAVHLDAAGISRRHARITITGANAVIEDLGSKNGTMVNDAPFTRSRLLHDGDRIQVGPTVVIYHVSASGMSTETIIRPAK
jgi:DNA-binding winged helix-turn-helix (wHTH) protein